jgi:hypothetical protein
VRFQSLAVTMFAALFLGSACSPEQSPPPAPPKPKVVEITLLPPKIPERASELQPDVVLFLPMVNRTARRIHPSYVRGFDRTLAAFADSQLGLRVVDPEIAGALSREMGFPDDYEAESSFVPNEESLNQAARRVGAGVVVWGELLPDQRVSLHAKALHPGADAVPWDGAGVKLEGSPDEAYFDGPRQLLRPWRSERISQDEEIPASAREELALAVRQAAQIDPTGIERAQATLSRLAESYPLWNAPWLELTALSARRVQWLGIGRGCSTSRRFRRVTWRTCSPSMTSNERDSTLSTGSSCATFGRTRSLTTSLRISPRTQSSDSCWPKSTAPWPAIASGSKDSSWRASPRTCCGSPR